MQRLCEIYSLIELTSRSDWRSFCPSESLRGIGYGTSEQELSAQRWPNPMVGKPEGSEYGVAEYPSYDSIKLRVAWLTSGPVQRFSSVGMVRARGKRASAAYNARESIMSM